MDLVWTFSLLCPALHLLRTDHCSLPILGLCLFAILRASICNSKAVQHFDLQTGRDHLSLLRVDRSTSFLSKRDAGKDMPDHQRVRSEDILVEVEVVEGEVYQCPGGSLRRDPLQRFSLSPSSPKTCLSRPRKAVVRWSLKVFKSGVLRYESLF